MANLYRCGGSKRYFIQLISCLGDTLIKIPDDIKTIKIGRAYPSQMNSTCKMEIYPGYTYTSNTAYLMEVKSEGLTDIIIDVSELTEQYLKVYPPKSDTLIIEDIEFIF